MNPNQPCIIDADCGNESHYENNKVCDINESTDKSVISQNNTSISAHPNSCDTSTNSNEKRIKSPFAKPYTVKINETNDT